ncbi:Hypothetical_protein [Hexamita inflata]|uniref:Hypothetical_protein n=1 Tax=Hexamita inflata TaxID=28002 RepID=A0AA86PVJ2_9EUKA|nr:Hypothetical protein HINF_LOCUS17169 [Hexamita inflata]CAI9947145.1 Hypothetical protein HINF_LOCUS34790 [Hexamita inflata]
MKARPRIINLLKPNGKKSGEKSNIFNSLDESDNALGIEPYINFDHILGSDIVRDESESMNHASTISQASPMLSRQKLKQVQQDLEFEKLKLDPYEYDENDQEENMELVVEDFKIQISDSDSLNKVMQPRKIKTNLISIQNSDSLSREIEVSDFPSKQNSNPTLKSQISDLKDIPSFKEFCKYQKK